MRLPLSPANSPAVDSVAAGSIFGVVAMLREMGRSDGGPVHQQVSSEVAVEGGWKDRSLLVENMVGAFAQRCDHLIADLEAVRQAPMLFNPMWPIVVLAAGTRNEEWLGFWSQMRGRL